MATSTEPINRHSHGLGFELLEQRRLLAVDPVITEFMASNGGSLEDGDGNSPDWIEVQNVGDTAVDLAGYRLTDRPDNLSKWVFPSIRVNPGDYLVVFASGQETDNYVDAGGSLHTNFALKSSGEYLALVAPDGTVVSQFGTVQSDYPAQRANISYGVAQQTTLVDAQSNASYLVPLSDQVDSEWTEANFDALANGFTLGKAAMGYETEPNTRTNFSQEIHTTLAPSTHTVYARIEFDVLDASAVNRLTLRMKYDDGFVAYLNGAKVAEANAPIDPQWFSSAPGRSQSDVQALEFADFGLTDHVHQLADGANVLAIHGLNDVSDLTDMLLVPQLTASVTSPSVKIGFMPTPTPGAENVAETEVFSGIVAKTQFSVERGFLDEPFDVSITTETPGAVIRYTTDGRPPSETAGSVYTGPIHIDTTTNLRVAAYKNDFVPTDVDTQTYLFLHDVIRQPVEPPSFPTHWRGREADYEMDPDVVDDPAYRDEIIDGLTSIRTMSIVMNPDDLFGSSGIYTNSEQRGPRSERPASVEILHPDGSSAFQVNSGIRIHGNSTRDPADTDKHSFRLEFRQRYGPRKLNYPLFPDAPVDRFDSIVLRAGLMHVDAPLISDTFARDTARDMGKVEGHATFVHLYLNGLYGDYTTRSSGPMPSLPRSILADVTKTTTAFFRAMQLTATLGATTNYSH